MSKQLISGRFLSSHAAWEQGYLSSYGLPIGHHCLLAWLGLGIT